MIKPAQRLTEIAAQFMRHDIEWSRGAYMIIDRRTANHIARLRPIPDTDRFELFYWSNVKGRWTTFGNLGRMKLMLESAHEIVEVGRFSLDQLLSDTSSINLQIKNVIDGHTEPCRNLGDGAEAERERRAKIVATEGEYQAAVKFATNIIIEHPVALQLRALQTMAEISIEKNSTIIFPAQFMTTVQEALAMVTKDSESK